MTLPRRLSNPGPVIEYVAELQRAGLKKEAGQAVEAIRSCLQTPDGAILLELLDKAILERSIPISDDPRALDANNAQSFIALDLRRVLSDEFDEKTEQIQPRVGTGRRRDTNA